MFYTLRCLLHPVCSIVAAATVANVTSAANARTMEAACAAGRGPRRRCREWDLMCNCRLCVNGRQDATCGVLVNVKRRPGGGAAGLSPHSYLLYPYADRSLSRALDRKLSVDTVLHICRRASQKMSLRRRLKSRSKSGASDIPKCSSSGTRASFMGNS